MTEDPLTTGQRIPVEAIDAAIRTQGRYMDQKKTAAQVLEIAKTFEDYIARERRHPPAAGRRRRRDSGPKAAAGPAIGDDPLDATAHHEGPSLCSQPRRLDEGDGVRFIVEEKMPGASKPKTALKAATRAVHRQVEQLRRRIANVIERSTRGDP